MGDSVLVVGDENLIRVHIHTKKPKSVLEFCNTKGKLKILPKKTLNEQAADSYPPNK